VEAATRTRTKRQWLLLEAVPGLEAVIRWRRRNGLEAVVGGSDRKKTEPGRGGSDWKKNEPPAPGSGASGKSWFQP
jgi:hypothetical protein